MKGNSTLLKLNKLVEKVVLKRWLPKNKAILYSLSVGSFVMALSFSSLMRTVFFQPEPAGTQAASMLMNTISPEQAGCTQPTRTVGGASVTFVGVQYDYQVPGRSIWFYEVCSGAMPATSHIVFAFCPEVGTSNVIPERECLSLALMPALMER